MVPEGLFNEETIGMFQLGFEEIYSQENLSEDILKDLLEENIAILVNGKNSTTTKIEIENGHTNYKLEANKILIRLKDKKLVISPFPETPFKPDQDLPNTSRFFTGLPSQTEVLENSLKLPEGSMSVTHHANIIKYQQIGNKANLYKAIWSYIADTLDLTPNFSDYEHESGIIFKTQKDKEHALQVLPEFTNDHFLLRSEHLITLDKRLRIMIDFNEFLKPKGRSYSLESLPDMMQDIYHTIHFDSIQTQFPYKG
jgi:hypothetical protein